MGLACSDDDISSLSGFNLHDVRSDRHKPDFRKDTHARNSSHSPEGLGVDAIVHIAHQQAEPGIVVDVALHRSLDWRRFHVI